jgi:hypothetical protein
MRQCLLQVLVYVVLGPCSKSEQHMHGIILIAESGIQLHGIWRDTADTDTSNAVHREAMPDLLPSPDAVQWSKEHGGQCHPVQTFCMCQLCAHGTYHTPGSFSIHPQMICKLCSRNRC